MFQTVHAPGLRGFAGLTTSMRKQKVTGARMNGVAVENTSLVQNEKEVGALNSFQITTLGFCIKLDGMLPLTSHNFGGGSKEIFK